MAEMFLPEPIEDQEPAGTWTDGWLTADEARAAR